MFSTFWLAFAACALSLAWLLPNHSPPWTTFHGDAWTAIVLTLVAAAVLWQRNRSTRWHALPLVVAALCCIPLMQYLFGLTPYFGTAWIQSTYLLGLLLALQVGEQWEREAPQQCADFVFLAIGIAAVVSTGLQLQQWMGLETIGPWTSYADHPGRYQANLAQPNMLGSLLLLGLIACGWGVFRRQLGATTALFTACFLLLGVALTGSRTAWLNLALLGLLAVVWQKRLPSRRYLWAAIGLGAYFILLANALPLIDQMVNPGEVDVAPRSFASGEIRTDAWTMLLDAASRRPLFGFGWGPLARANFLVIDDYSQQVQGIFTYSHNLILDLILYNGYPVGLAVAAVLGWWFWRALRSAADFADFSLIAFVLILGTHAMLEFPLQYAYFLLPLGLIVGALNTSLGFRPVLIASSNWANIGFLIVAAAALSITIRDYLRVETSFYGLRFEQRKIVTTIPSAPPEVLVLTQFRDYLIFARNVPRSGLDPRELNWMRELVNTIPSAHIMYKLAANLAMNEQPEEARAWLRRLCKTTPSCESIRKVWEAESKSNRQLAAVPWPVEYAKTRDTR